MPGEPPPPPPRAFFGREELIERVVTLAEGLNPIALVGVGGIGKTAIALTVLHHGRIKQRFGENRRFIRCDQFPASRANLLRRLSKAIGSAVENPEDLAPLRRSLSSGDMIIILDNAESILDPQGPDGQGIYHLVDEISQFTNICLVITSRVTTLPPNCETLDIPTLSIEAAQDTFYRIYKYDGRTDSVGNLLKQLDFHPLSITLLATVAHQNKWDNNRLAREWEKHHTGVLQTGHNSLGATIDLSLSSPMFKQLGPNARDLLGVVAFFPQGVNEENLDWLFPTIPDVATTLDMFCVLSLTYRSDRFVTMLVPLRDYLRPKDPLSSPLLSTAKESYFTRLSAKPELFMPGSKETQWITSEDTNVEHLFNIFMSVDAKSDRVWGACVNFLNLLYWHKSRPTVLGPKIKQLPDDSRFKPDCLFWLSQLFCSLGNHVEEKQLLEHALNLESERGNDSGVALVLIELSGVNDCSSEGIGQAKESLEIFERLGDTGKQGHSLNQLAWALFCNDQLGAAEEAASRAIQLLSEKGQEFRICESHLYIGRIYQAKGEREKAIYHFKTTLGIASCFSWNGSLSFWAHHSLAMLFIEEDKLDDAHAHLEQAKSHAVNNAHHRGCAAFLLAEVYHKQCRLEDAMSEALYALGIFEEFRILGYIEDCRDRLEEIREAMENRDTSPVSSPEECYILCPLTHPCSPLPVHLPSSNYSLPWKRHLRTLTTHVPTESHHEFGLFPPFPQGHPPLYLITIP